MKVSIHLILIASVLVEAFVPLTTKTKTNHHHHKNRVERVALLVLSGESTSNSNSNSNSNNNNSDNNNEENSDVEDARKRFESMIQPEERTASSLDSGRPILTSIQRERRKAEIHLLDDLSVCDEAVAQLWTLWYGERGPQASLSLREGDEWMDEGDYGKAEQRFKELIRIHGIHWAEPVNRLATLYFLQGRMEESKQLCEVVLQVKPWHFGALNGIVMVCGHLQDVEGARKWAAQRLPGLAPQGTTSSRRDEWVERVVSIAEKSLKEDEKKLKSVFGPKAEIQSVGRVELEDDAWQ